MNLWKFVLSYQIALFFYLILGDTPAQLDKKIVFFFLMSLFDSEDVKLWTQAIEVEMNDAIFCKAIL